LNDLILIKLGGSVITDKSKEFVAREENIKRLAREIKEGQKAFSGEIIIGHGAGSFAHTPAAKYRTKRGLLNSSSLMGASIVEDAARQLNSIVIKNFLAENLPVFPFSPASFLINDAKGNSMSYIDPIKQALLTEFLPVIYGDVVIDKSQGFTIFSTEKVLSIIAKELKNSYLTRIILVTDVDGVLDKEGKTISRISKENFDQLKEGIIGAKNVDVTGGMLNKVEESLTLANDAGIETLIINGLKEGNLEKAIKGEEVLGTKIQNPN